MSMRVATFAATNQMLNASLRVQARMTELQLQEATGTKSSSYGGYGADSGQLINLQTSLARSEAYSAAMSEADDRIDAMYSALGDVSDLITDFRSQIAAALSTDGDETSMETLATTAQSYLEELASVLNTKFEGRYLFSGSLTETAPVDLDGYVADISTASTSYYDGNDNMASVKASSELVVTYGIGANESAFEEAIRALSSLANTSETLTTDDLEAAYDLLDSALDGTVTLQSGLSVAASSLDRLDAWQADYRDMLEASISEIRDVDVAAVTVTLTTYQTQLEASYAALAKIMSLSLQDYL